MKEASVEEFMEAMKSFYQGGKQLFKKGWLDLAQNLSPQERRYCIQIGTENIKEMMFIYGSDRLEEVIKVYAWRAQEDEKNREKQKEKERNELLLRERAIKDGIYPQMREPVHPYHLQGLDQQLNPIAYRQMVDQFNQGKIEGYHFLILQRWATYFPRSIYNLDMSDLIILSDLQAQMELDILDSAQGEINRAMGITDMEQLEMWQINLYYYLIDDCRVFNPVLSKAMQQDKQVLEQMGISLKDLNPH